MKASRMVAGVQAIVAAAAVLLAAGCAAASANDTPHGAVSGTFIREGGPISPGGLQPRKVPLPGIVTFTSADGQVFRVRVEISGKFRASLPAGRYKVSGTSPELVYSGKLHHQRPCSLPLSVTVSAHHTAKVTVACAVP